MRKGRNTYFLPQIVVGLVVAFFILGSIAWIKWDKRRSESDEKHLEELYWQESIAFGIEPSYGYKDFSCVSLNSLNIKIASYKFNCENADITIDDIKEFLSSEYDENGKPKVLNFPQDINDYMDWYWRDGGVTFSRDYMSGLTNYHLDHMSEYGDKDILSMDEQMLCRMIEDFNSTPDIEIYMDLQKWSERHFSD